MKLRYILPVLVLLMISCSTENEKADDSILGIWKITKAFQGNQAGANEVALVACENYWRYSFGTDYFFNITAVEGNAFPCPLPDENTYKWAETATNAYECRHIDGNELYFTATIEDGTMTMYRPDIDTTYLLKHATN